MRMVTAYYLPQTIRSLSDFWQSTAGILPKLNLSFLKAALDMAALPRQWLRIRS